MGHRPARTPVRMRIASTLQAATGGVRELISTPSPLPGRQKYGRMFARRGPRTRIRRYQPSSAPAEGIHRVAYTEGHRVEADIPRPGVAEDQLLCRSWPVAFVHSASPLYCGVLPSSVASPKATGEFFRGQ